MTKNRKNTEKALLLSQLGADCLELKKLSALSAQDRLLDAAQQTVQQLTTAYRVSLAGLDSPLLPRLRILFGENVLRRTARASLGQRLVKAFINPFTVVLLILACISFVTDYVIVPPEQKDLTAVCIVVLMVLASGILRFVQEARSSNAAEQLQNMVTTTIATLRDGQSREISIHELVVGDIIHLAAGDMIPADVRILETKDLFVSQSSLTGESEPVEKFSNPLQPLPASVLECNNLAFMGSNVVSGGALAMVVTVGQETLLGALASQLATASVQNRFEMGVNSVSWVLIRFMMCMIPIVLFVNGFTKGDWMEATLFALSVAVGLTPEMLPMIVSANLARGAVSMSRKKVIVKHLNAIQNIGAMDVLCTDKTGTLTQDRIILEFPLDVRGNEDQRVLRHAFLNSYHQTGLKNLMDVAIIEHASEKHMLPLWQDYTKVDEIPFDFTRRRMSVVVSNAQGKTQIITKGAVEEMLQICSHVEYDSVIEPLTDALRQKVLETVRGYNKNGLRVVAVAHKSHVHIAGGFSVADEADMVLMGYVAFLDPPKESAVKALEALKDYGVQVKVLTGDNADVTRAVCRQVNLPVENIVLGSDLEAMDEAVLRCAVEENTVFAKLTPQQKTRIVGCLRQNGHTVGFMGDGINDAAAMKASDVGISVDTAVDIAKESADIILLEKDLMVLEQGAIEGRKTYANIIKYIKMTASSNFGNMFSVLVASAFLPFLPMAPLQILVLNFIYDISCITIPWDNVDTDFLKKPRTWDASSITKFMLWLGPTSSIFDIITYGLMYFYICPLAFGGDYHSLAAPQQLGFVALFQAGWFVESLWSQTLVIHMIRTPYIPFLQSRASWQLTTLTMLGIGAGTCIPFISLGTALDMAPLPLVYFAFLAAIIVLYMLLATFVKNLFVKQYGELL